MVHLLSCMYRPALPLSVPCALGHQPFQITFQSIAAEFVQNAAPEGPELPFWQCCFRNLKDAAFALVEQRDDVEQLHSCPALISSTRIDTS